MSKVAIVLVPADARPRVLHRIHRITGLGMSEIAARTDAGRPIVECTLFYNDHDEVSGRLRDLLDALELEGVTPRLFELEEDEQLETVADIERVEITAEILRNILDAHHEELQRRHPR